VPPARLLTLTVLLATLAFAKEPGAAGEELFTRRVAPLLREKCLACHGHDEARIKGGLDLRTRAEALLGGDSAKPALVAGRPEESPIYLAARRNHADWKAMPPKEAEALSAAQLGWLHDWIAGGAPWPDAARQAEIRTAHAAAWSAEDGVTVATSRGLSADWNVRRYRPEDLWAYQPVRKPAIPAAAAGTHPIDAFLEERLANLGLASAPPANARTLIRRMAFSLTGLPPPPEEVAALLLDAARPWIDGDPATAVVERSLHRWKFALPTTLIPEPLVAVSTWPPVACCGDAFAEPRVEGAAASGLAAGRWMLRTLA